MGNYKNLDTDFIERTLKLISQYEIKMHDYDFRDQYNHTLLINCLLGLIVFPKERIMKFLPKQNLADKKNREEMGLVNSNINPDIKDLKDLIISLRHSLAHFDISFESDNAEEFLIDRVVFSDNVKAINYVVAEFKPDELLSFVRYYANWLLFNIRKYGELHSE
jgi:hypothetical protein